MGILTLIGAPTFAVATLMPLADIKAHCRIDHSLDDAYLENLALAAVELAEKETKRPIQRQTYEYEVSEWFPKYRLTHTHRTELLKVEYENTDGVRTTLWTAGDSVSVFRVTSDDYVRNGMYSEAPGDFSSLIITYKGGYATVNDVPRTIVLGCMTLTLHLYEQRSIVTDIELSRIPHSMRYLFAAFKKHHVL